jgi:riboflavin synthase
VFTGIVRELGEVVSVDGGRDGIRLVIRAPATASSTAVGDSISIGGACLTAVDVGDGTIALDAVPETLARTTLGSLSSGAAVNIEPALRVGDPLGGHFVQGHVDAVGRVRSLEPEGEGARVWVEAPPEILRYCVEKGSIAVEGVSLTIAALEEEAFAVALVPHTLQATTLGTLRPGDDVNLEADLLAKYARRS